MKLTYKYILLFVLLFFITAQSETYWIYFQDKGNISKSDYYLLAQEVLSRKSIAKKRIEFSDLPLNDVYIRKIKKNGLKIKHKSRWFNAVSVYAKPEQLEKIRKNPWVKKIEPVKIIVSDIPLKNESEVLKKSVNSDYGASFEQNNLIGVPVLHDLGYSGEDIIIALFDSGFRLEHEALQHIHPLAQYDFVEKDSDVSGARGYSHGTQVLGVIAGYKSGQLIGPAYGADYVLAKTEDILSERHIEEDNWVAAAEWADSIGVDIISTSLGYNLFDPGEGNYDYQDMDGNTTIVTRAADLAVKKGIAVFASAGNEGQNSWFHIIAPADGDSVIAVGGTNSKGLLWPQSSRGPSSDGQIKPDVVAQAQNVVTVDPERDNVYVTGSGTSYSCPQAAGAAALVWSMMRDLSPVQLTDLLKNSATQPQNPDNEYGFGVIDLVNLVHMLENDPIILLNDFTIQPAQGRNVIKWSTSLEVLNEKWTLQRRLLSDPYIELANIMVEKGSRHLQEYRYIDYDIEPGQTYLYRLSNVFENGDKKIIDSAWVYTLNPVAFELNQNYPNPFNNLTNIIVSVNSEDIIDLIIYDDLGRIVTKLAENKAVQPGFYHYRWHPPDKFASGTYIVALKSKKQIDTKKAVLLK